MTRTLDGAFYCSRREAEELAHAAYLLATREALEREQQMARAFEARIRAAVENRDTEPTSPESADSSEALAQRSES